MVHSGDVLVLGGLINHDVENTYSKLPILGSLPGIGKLFTNTNKTYTKKNLMVFLRPVIIDRRPVSQDMTGDRYEYMRQLELLRRAGASVVTNLDETPLLPPTHKPIPNLPAPFAAGLPR